MKYTQKQILWKPTSPTTDDDFIAHIAHPVNDKTISCCLRVEAMDIDAWWACIYIDDQQEWDNNGTWTKTERGAKEQVVKALNKYLENLEKN